jgi:monoamine oxidase
MSIAVVGAGCSGAYSALRLRREGNEVDLFEFSDRIGGRVYTRTLPRMPHVHAEVGGMRFIPDQHKLVAGMVTELGLRTRPFPMGSSDPLIGPRRNYVYLRGKHLLYGDLSDSSKAPYNVNWSERNMNPDELQTWAYQYVVPKWNDPNLDLFQVKVFGKKLYDYGLWDLLYLLLSPEAYAFMLDAGGYDSNVANANAASALPSDDFGPEIVYETLVDGYDQLPKQIVHAFEVEGGKLHLQRRLLSINRSNRGGLCLLFAKTVIEESDDGVRHSIVNTVEREEVEVDNVVLAMPRRSLELVDWAPMSDPRVDAMIRSVVKQAAFKLFLGYEYPWWKVLNLESGRAITDTPLRQLYYFGTEEEAIGGEPGNMCSLLMASYNDLRSVPFWKAFENDPPFIGKESTRSKPQVLRQTDPATTGMVKMAQRLVREIHGLRSLPQPYTAIFHDWSQDPFGAGWHAWKAGIRYDRVMKEIRKPVEGWSVFICGEAYSVNQGWVEGALQTAERMLEEHFSLQRPSWLPADYDLGP